MSIFNFFTQQILGMKWLSDLITLFVENILNLDISSKIGGSIQFFIYEAVRFLRAHAAEYDIDKTRVCAFGTSSGGNTALLLGLTGDDPAFRTDEFADESDAVMAVVDCFGPTDINRMIDVQFAAMPKNDENLLYALGGRDPETYRERLARISPVNYAKPGTTLPPFLILHGDADPIVLYEDSARFYNQLIAAGHRADLVRVTGAPHEGNFWSPQLLEIIFDFIKENTK